jgi:hypothetical protein
MFDETVNDVSSLDDSVFDADQTVGSSKWLRLFLPAATVGFEAPHSA